MIQPDHPTLSIVQQCRLASIGRSTFYRVPRGESAENLELMAKIDRQFLETPFYGAQQMTWHLKAEGHTVNVKRVRRLMRLIGLMPIYRQPRTSIPAKGHKLYPYLLRGVRIDRPNQVWCADITYIPLAKGFLYLVAIMDWWSRKVLAWRLSNTMDVQFCVDALDEALDRHDRPEIFNTDQGSQFTSWADTAAEGGRGTHLDGWTWPVPRQHLHRTAMALAEVRMHLPACLLGRARGPSGDRRLDGLLQSSAPPCRAWWRDAGQSISSKAVGLRPGLRPALHPTALAA
jgi:putative transposase